MSLYHGRAGRLAELDMINGLLEQSLPTFVTGIPDYFSLDHLVTHHFRQLDRESMFSLYCFALSRDERDELCEFIHLRLSRASLSLLDAILLDDEPYTAADCHLLVLTLLVGLLAFYDTAPVRSHFGRNAPISMLVYAHEIALSDAGAQALCHHEVQSLPPLEPLLDFSLLLFFHGLF